MNILKRLTRSAQELAQERLEQTPLLAEGPEAFDPLPSFPAADPLDDGRDYTQPPQGNKTVLLIEDDSTSSYALGTILRRQGWEVTTAKTLAEGMRQLDARPHQVILDLMLPDGDGDKILQHIRASNLPMRVMVTTGSLDPAQLARVNSHAPDAILSKPLNLNSLLRELATA